MFNVECSISNVKWKGCDIANHARQTVLQAEAPVSRPIIPNLRPEMYKTSDALVARYVGFGLLFLGAALMVYLVRGALPVFIVAGLLAFAFEPVLQRLEKSGRSRLKAVGFVFVIILLIGMILLALLASAFQQGQSLVANIETYNSQVLQLIDSNRERLQQSKLPLAVKESVNEAIENNLQSFQQRVPALATDFAARTLAGTGSFLANLFLLNLLTFGFMLEANRIKARLLMIVPPFYRRDVTDLATSINELLGRYVRGQLIVCLTFGALCTVAFEIISRVFGMQYPLVLGAVAAVIYVLPYFGLAVVFVAAVATAYLTSAQPVPAAVAVMICVIIINLITDYGVAPRVLGRGVGLHPLLIIFALVCGFHVGGPLGTVVAVPLLASLRVIAIYLFPQLAAPIPTEEGIFPDVPTPPEPQATLAKVAVAENTVESPVQARAL